MGSGSSLEHHDLSHVGLRRSNNQDSRGVVEPWSREQYRRRGWLFVVADGMGAHAAGETASEMAVQEVTSAYEKLVAIHSPPIALRMSLEDANRKINARGDTSPDLRGMGTTCTALALLPRGAIVGHVGDSRAYRVRHGTIEQLTRDHSLVWDLEAQAGRADGVLPAVVPKNIITNSMGPHATLKVDLEGPFPVQDGDVYVLCSDGLSGQVADEEIGALAAALAPEEASAALVGLALVRGAPDNVTVIVARAGEKERSRASATDPPWLREPPDHDSVRRPPLPWPMLAVAAGSLLGALICMGIMGSLWPRNDLKEPLDISNALFNSPRFAVTLALCVLSTLAFIGSLLAAVLGFLVPAGGGSVLHAGEMLGKGPYRSHDCRPTRQLVEGIAASVEAAADGLDVPAGQDCVAPLGRARAAAEAADFTTAFAATAEGLAAFRRFVDASR